MKERKKGEVNTGSQNQPTTETQDELLSSKPKVDKGETPSGSDKKERIQQGTELKMAQFEQLIPEEERESIQNIDMLLDVTLPVTVELGRSTLQIKDILKLSKGSIIELDKSVGEYVEMVVNNKVIAKGEVVVIEENFGFRITELVSNGDIKG